MDISPKKSGLAGFLKKRMTAKNGAEFIFRLGEMLAKGFTIRESIDFLMLNIQGISGKQTKHIRQMLQAGTPLHEILPILHVPSLICLQVYFAEKHGNVQDALIHAGAQWKKSEQSKAKLIKLLQYPIFLLLLLVMLLAVLNTFVLPQFHDLHASMGYEPEGIILLLLFLLEWVPPIMLILLPCAIGLSIFLYARYRLLSPKKKADMLIRIPYVRTFFQLYFTRLFARESAQLLNSGFAVNEMLHIFERQTIYPMLTAVSEIIDKRLMNGESLQEAIKKMAWFDKKLSALTGHGGANGRLGEELLMYAEFCDELVEEKIKKLTGFIQPAVFLFIGVVVMTVYLSVMLPMFEMMGSV
ncbi:competence type IV pilus assembly protein ComGB [Domibacillus aminovorans]|nr:competence type IV pilus assembly protein ComGB [Domibacillus aminovorans]